MGENDDLKILIEAALDFARSMQNISQQLSQLQAQLNNYRLKITAGLDQATSASQIRQDLGKIDKGKPQIHLVGKVDRNATKAEVEKAVKSLKGVEVKLSTVLDPLEAGKQLKSSVPDVPTIEASATVKVDGTEQVDELSKKLENAGNNATGMASKVYLARTALQLLRRTVKEAVDTITELDACVTDLAMATGQNREEAYQLLEGYNDLAERLGATTGQIARAADEWLRQGHSIADTTSLIEDAMVLSKISQLDSANATQYLTSAMKGYQVAAQRACAGPGAD